MERVLITGASRGLGYELLKVFSIQGHMTFPLVRSIESAEALQTEFSDRCHPIVADLNSDEVISSIETALNLTTDRIDILINNAGISGYGSRIEEVQTEEVNNLFNVHCLGPIRAVKGSINYLRESNNPRIINISSRLGSLKRMASGEFKDMGFSYSYRMAKAAQNMFSICLSQELLEENIVVSAIHPGQLNTRGGSPDSNTHPSVAAKSIYEWAKKLDIEQSGFYLQPLVGEIPW
jgi:NAD(P)-dependent dehydrogenase (short-subunit alcohol dehydrogenase family)